MFAKQQTCSWNSGPFSMDSLVKKRLLHYMYGFRIREAFPQGAASYVVLPSRERGREASSALAGSGNKGGISLTSTCGQGSLFRQAVSLKALYFR